jgi:hypothetical protein
MTPSTSKNESVVERFGKHALAGVVLLIAAWIVIKLVIGIVAALFVPVLIIAAIAAMIWAYRVLF